jgi:hypothetical protein
MNIYILLKLLKFFNKFYRIYDLNGDWGLGIGDWGLGPIPNPQSPIPNPQSPYYIYLYISIKNILIWTKKVQKWKKSPKTKNRTN